MSTTPKFASLRQVKRLISVAPQNSYLLVGPPGIGKTEILTSMFSPDEYNKVIIDASSADSGDTSLPRIVERVSNGKTISVVEFVAAARFGFGVLNADGSPRKCFIVIDELGKARADVVPMFNRLMNERMAGDEALPPGSVVVATANSITDGVGDNLPAHTLNRVTTLRVRPPTPEEWIEDWANPNNMHPLLIEFATFRTDANEGLFDFYLDVPDPTEFTNRMVFNPFRADSAHEPFCTPRALARLNPFFYAAFGDHPTITDDELSLAISGTIGSVAESAFRLSAMLSGRSVCRLKDLRSDPASAREKYNRSPALGPLMIGMMLDDIGRTGRPTASESDDKRYKEQFDIYEAQAISDLNLVADFVLAIDNPTLTQLTNNLPAQRAMVASRYVRDRKATSWSAITRKAAAVNNSMTSMLGL